MNEGYIHNLIQSSDDLKLNILNLLGENSLEGITFIHEFRMTNNMIIDFLVLKKNYAVALIEVKGHEISTTDFVRGLGQVGQYSDVINRPEMLKGYTVDVNTKYVLLIPSSVFTSNRLSLNQFSIKDYVELFEINIDFFVRKVTKKEIETIQNNLIDGNTILISNFYFRDNRIYELYMLLKILALISLSRTNIIGGPKKNKISRTDLELKHLRNLNVSNPKNWRNAFITLSSLGLINDRNLCNRTGSELAFLDYNNFLWHFHKNYALPYIKEIFKLFENSVGDYVIISNSDIVHQIKENNNNKDIIFLTQSNSRYISSWMNILRDDYGSIMFNSRNKRRFINFNPMPLNQEYFIRYIEKFSTVNDKIVEFENYIKNHLIF